MVPDYDIPGAVRFRDDPGAHAALPAVRYAAGRPRLPAVHRRHHRGLKGAMLTHRNLVANMQRARPGWAPTSAWATS